MKVSVIVPVYKAEKYLRQCLDSLVGQTMDDYEIILVNDGSPDGSQSIIDEYKANFPDRIVSLVIDNGGQGRARNFGIDIARGEYIGFVDSDDWVDITMYEKLYHAAKDADADLVLCDCVEVDGRGEKRYMDTSVCTDKMLVSGSVCDKLIRRELIGELRFPCGLWYEDMELAVKLMLRAEKSVSVPEGLYFYRVSHTSTMRNNNAGKNLDILTVAENIRQFMEQNGMEGSYDVLLLNHITIDAVNRVAKQNAGDKQEVIKTLCAYVRRYVPRLTRSGGYRKAGRNRRIVMFLNYHGLWRASKLLLTVKAQINRI